MSNRKGSMSKKAVLKMRTNSIRKRGFTMLNEKYERASAAKNVENWSDSKLLKRAAAEARKNQRLIDNEMYLG